MNYGHIKTLLLSAIVIFAAAACTPMRKMAKNIDKVTVRVNPNELEVKNDTISFEVFVNFPRKYVAKNSHIIVKPVFRYGNKYYQMEPYYVLGEKSDFEVPEQTNRKRTISHKDGGNIRFSEKIPFDSEMMMAVLRLDLALKIDSDYEELEKCYYTEKDSVRVGVITTPLRVVNNEDKLMGGGLGPQVVTEDFFIPFDIQSSIIRTAFIRGPEMQRLREFVRIPRLTITNVSVNAFSSPDGPINFNERLSRDRMNSSYAFIMRELRRLGVDAIHDTQFLREFTWEDWMGFKRLVEQSNLENKQQILSLINELDFLQKLWEDFEKNDQEPRINGNERPPSRVYIRSRLIDEEDYKEQLRKVESKIREFEKDWEDMAENLFPQLRRTEVRLHGYFPLRDLDEIMKLGKEDINKLYEREVQNYAHYSEDLEEKKRAYRHYINKWEKDWIGYNNLAVLKLQSNRPETEKALELLKKAKEISPNEKVIINNMGVAYAYLGDYVTAIDYYNRAQKAGVDVKNNLGILSIRMGEYDKANDYLKGKECDHNAALALTLTGNNQQALERLECIVEKNADNFYLRAVIAARNNDIELMNTSLTRAIRKDAQYRQMAQRDLEFQRYWNDLRFQNAIR